MRKGGPKSTYTPKVLDALYELNEATANELANTSGVDIRDVYRSIKTLVRRGFALPIRVLAPKKWRIVK